MSSGTWLCLPFSAKGKSCAKGYQCTNHHATLKNVSLPNLQIIDKWVNDNPAMSLNGHPTKLADANTTPALGIPPAAVPATQVSPVVNGGNNQTQG